MNDERYKDFVVEGLEKALKQKYGARVQVERYGRNDVAPTARDLQVELYGKRYIDDLSHLYEAQAQRQQTLANLRTSIDIQTLLTLQQVGEG